MEESCRSSPLHAAGLDRAGDLVGSFVLLGGTVFGLLLDALGGFDFDFDFLVDFFDFPLDFVRLFDSRASFDLSDPSAFERFLLPLLLAFVDFLLLSDFLDLDSFESFESSSLCLLRRFLLACDSNVRILFGSSLLPPSSSETAKWVVGCKLFPGHDFDRARRRRTWRRRTPPSSSASASLITKEDPKTAAVVVPEYRE